MATKKQTLAKVEDMGLYAKEKQRVQELINDMGEDESSHVTIRSLGWRWPVVACVALSITAFVIGWVAVTNITANAKIRVEQIDHSK